MSRAKNLIERVTSGEDPFRVINEVRAYFDTNTLYRYFKSEADDADDDPKEAKLYKHVATRLNGKNPLFVIDSHIDEAIESYIKGFPANTKLVLNGMRWSIWDGNLALVTGPSGLDRYPPTRSDFDPDTLARRYAVRPALTLDKKHPVKAERSDFGFEPHVADRRADYEKTTWSMGTPGYGPLRQGTFGPVTAYWVEVSLKDLSPGEVQTVLQQLDGDDFLDVTYNKESVNRKEWEKLVKITFPKTQELDSKLANAAYDAVKEILHRYPDNEAEEQKTWSKIGGVYKTDKKRGRILWYFYK